MLAPPCFEQRSTQKLTRIPPGGIMLNTNDTANDREESAPQDDQQEKDKQSQEMRPEPERKEPETAGPPQQAGAPEQRPPEGAPHERRRGARGTAAMDAKTRQEVARKGGLAVSRNRQHMAEIGRKGGQTVSKNREHMAEIGRKGGEASRGHK
jgi:general stress protein YciG